jgi:hypothetical protein
MRWLDFDAHPEVLLDAPVASSSVRNDEDARKRLFAVVRHELGTSKAAPKESTPL